MEAGLDGKRQGQAFPGRGVHARERPLHPRPAEQRDLRAVEEEGRKDAEQIGLEEAKRWLARYDAPPIDPGLDEALLE